MPKREYTPWNGEAFEAIIRLDVPASTAAAGHGRHKHKTKFTKAIEEWVAAFMSWEGFEEKLAEEAEDEDRKAQAASLKGVSKEVLSERLAEELGVDPLKLTDLVAGLAAAKKKSPEKNPS